MVVPIFVFLHFFILCPFLPYPAIFFDLFSSSFFVPKLAGIAIGLTPNLLMRAVDFVMFPY